MKPLRILLALAFLLSIGSLTAYARAEDLSYAYLPLVFSNRDASIPIEFQARQAFQSLTADLLRAQAQGQIAGFEPELHFGMVRVAYRPGVDLRASIGNGRPIFNGSQSALDYVRSLGILAAASDRAADATPHFYIGINESCFDGENLGAGDYFVASLSKGSGPVLASSNGWVDASGYLWGCFEGGVSNMAPGYKATFKIYNSAGTTLIKTYPVAIPNLGYTSIDIPTHTATGTSVANSVVDVELYHPKLDAANGYTSVTKTVTTSSTGSWQADFGTTMRGGDEVYLDWFRSSAYTTFSNNIFAASVYCRLGSSYCDLYGIPGQTGSLSIKHAGNTYTFTGQFDLWGELDGSIPAGSLVVGDKASGTGVAALTLPAITAIPHYTSDTVTGKAPASRYFEVYLDWYQNPFTSHYYNRWVGSNSSRDYVADFSSSMDIKSTSYLYASVYFTYPNNGNEVAYSYSTHAPAP